jgi:hypothetical protein
MGRTIFFCPPHPHTPRSIIGLQKNRVYTSLLATIRKWRLRNTHILYGAVIERRDIVLNCSGNLDLVKQIVVRFLMFLVVSDIMEFSIFSCTGGTVADGACASEACCLVCAGLLLFPQHRRLETGNLARRSLFWPLQIYLR